MYEPTTWRTGDVVTSAKLNKLEKGVEDSGLVVHMTITQEGGTMTVTLDKTYRQIKDAIESGIMPVLLNSGATEGINSLANVIYYGINGDGKYFLTVTGETNFYADAEDDYPVYRQA